MTIDLAWPYGIRQNYNEKPVALVLGEADEVADAARRANFQVFTSVPAFYRYIEQQVLAEGVANEEILTR